MKIPSPLLVSSANSPIDKPLWFSTWLSPTNFKIYSKTNGNLNKNCSGQLLSKKTQAAKWFQVGLIPQMEVTKPLKRSLKTLKWVTSKNLGAGRFLLHILLPLSPFVVPSLPNPPMAPLDLLGRHPKWSSKVMVETQVSWSQKWVNIEKRSGTNKPKDIDMKSWKTYPEVNIWRMLKVLNITISSILFNRWTVHAVEKLVECLAYNQQNGPQEWRRLKIIDPEMSAGRSGGSEPWSYRWWNWISSCIVVPPNI